MADQIAPGASTSEFFLTKIIVYGGMVFTAAGAALQALQASGASFGWLPAVMMVVGMGSAVVKALGYTNARKELKIAEIDARPLPADLTAWMQAQAAKAAPVAAPVATPPAP